MFRMRYALILSLLFTMPFSVWAFVYRPMNFAVYCVANEIKIRSKNLDYYDEVNRQYRNLKSITTVLDTSTASALSKIPSKSVSEKWLKSASDAAKEYGLLVRSVTTAGERIESDFCVLPVDLNVSGSFESLYQLIQHIERMPRISRIDRLNIQLVDDNIIDARMIVELLSKNGGGS